MTPLAILAVATVVLVVLIVRLRVHAFLALLVSTLLVGLLSPRIPLGDVVPETALAFGSMVGRIGIALAMAAIVGQCLTASGAAFRIVRWFVSLLGERRASLSLVASGYVLAVPVFFDTVFYLLVPLARAMSARMGGRQYVLLVLAISAGGSVSHVFVPPTPGPLAMAATLGVDVGAVMLAGLVVGVPAALCGWLYAVFIDRRLAIPLRPAPGESLERLREQAERPESELPGLVPSLLPIALPVALITAATVGRALGVSGPTATVLDFLGNANLALLLAAAAALFVLARQRGTGPAGLAPALDSAIGSAGVIILITATGGAFGAMLVKAGVGETLSALSEGSRLSPLVLAFLLAALFKTAQGSGTVAMITVSAILAPLVEATPPPYHLAYLVMATGAGSLVGQWMNDSGFWIFRTMTGLTEVETLTTKSVMMAVLGFSAMAVTLLASRLLPFA